MCSTCTLFFNDIIACYLSVTSSPFAAKQEKKSKKKAKSSGGVANVQLGGAGNTATGAGMVNEQKVDLLLDMLKSADVTDTSQEESKTVKQLESEGEWGEGERERETILEGGGKGEIGRETT